MTSDAVRNCRRQENGERRMLAPLLDWLFETGRLDSAAVIEFEFPWFRRRVDVATLTASNISASFELKLGSIGRVLEQAAYNRMAFDRSYIVTESTPRDENLEIAEHEGIGIVRVRGRTVEELVSPTPTAFDVASRTTLVARLAARRGASSV